MYRWSTRTHRTNTEFDYIKLYIYTHVYMHKHKNTSNVVNPIDKTTTRSPEIGVRTRLPLQVPAHPPQSWAERQRGKLRDRPYDRWRMKYDLTKITRWEMIRNQQNAIICSHLSAAQIIDFQTISKLEGQYPMRNPNLIWPLSAFAGHAWNTQGGRC